jgi:proteasome lid subunit RPN8/RPN11
MSKDQREELVSHAREESPNECCGYLWAADGVVEGVTRAENERRSPYGYQLDARSMLAAWKLAEEEGYHVGIYHSHPRSPAEPSQTDINLAEWPDWSYLIVSLAADEPVVRAWRIADGRVDEEEVVVDGDH